MIVDLSKLAKPPEEPPRPRLRFVRLGHLESVTERLFRTRELIAQLEREAPAMRPYPDSRPPCHRFVASVPVRRFDRRKGKHPKR